MDQYRRVEPPPSEEAQHVQHSVVYVRPLPPLEEGVVLEEVEEGPVEARAQLEGQEDGALASPEV